MAVIDEAVTAMLKPFTDIPGSTIYEAFEGTLEVNGYEPFLETLIDALPADLLRRLADEKDGRTPVFVGTEDALYDWLAARGDSTRKVEVYVLAGREQNPDG